MNPQFIELLPLHVAFTENNSCFQIYCLFFFKIKNFKEKKWGPVSHRQTLHSLPAKGDLITVIFIPQLHPHGWCDCARVCHHGDISTFITCGWWVFQGGRVCDGMCPSSIRRPVLMTPPPPCQSSSCPATGAERRGVENQQHEGHRGLSSSLVLSDLLMLDLVVAGLQGGEIPEWPKSFETLADKAAWAACALPWGWWT